MLHALGTYHEHTRGDRDQFVRVLWDNIEDGFKNNFIKSRDSSDMSDPLPICMLFSEADDNCYSGKTTSTFGIEYDFRSLMHYPADA